MTSKTYLKRVLIILLFITNASTFVLYTREVKLKETVLAQMELSFRERGIITNELTKIRNTIHEISEILTKTGKKSTYARLLTSQYGENAKTIIKNQRDFNFSSLKFADSKSFFKSVIKILSSLQLRLLFQFRDLSKYAGLLFDKKQSQIVKNIPAIWPAEGVISSPYGLRFHPIDKKKKFHSGIDIANLKSTDILSTADGVVEFSGKKGGYGNSVIINHGNGFKTLYGHADYLLVGEGDTVQKGTVIARMGSTGKSTGSHLHYEVLFAGEVVDPAILVR